AAATWRRIPAEPPAGVRPRCACAWRNRGGMLMGYGARKGRTRQKCWPPRSSRSRMIEFGHSTHVGLRREHNEDTYHADADLGLWLVADGMGGHEHGEVASALARDTLVRETRAGTGLVRAVQLADEEIIRHSTRRSEALPMGTTIAALRLRGSEFEVAWVGDSRIYLWN